MRRFIAATLTAALVVIGLSAVLIGTASASVPVPTASLTCAVAQVNLDAAKAALAANPADPGDVLRAAVNSAQAALLTCTQTTPPSTRHCSYNEHWDNRLNRCVNDTVGFPRGNSPWNDRLDGRYFRLDRGPALDVCNSDYGTYDLFLSRNGSYRDRISRQLNAQRFADLRRADCGVVVSNDGSCVTYVTARDSIRNYTNDYNRLRGNFGHLNNSDRDRLNRAYSLSRRYSNDWNANLSKLRTVCNDTTPTVTIINEAPPAPVVVTQAAPAPAYTAPAPSGVSAGSIPSGSVNTGGFSAAYMLAHARAI